MPFALSAEDQYPAGARKDRQLHRAAQEGRKIRKIKKLKKLKEIKTNECIRKIKKIKKLKEIKTNLLAFSNILFSLQNY